MMWWPPYRKRVLAEADEYLESFGERAWEECNLDYVANMFKDEKRHRFLADVQRAISKKMDRDRKLDAALPTRLSPEPQAPYDHGPGYVTYRPADKTLH